MGRSIKENRYIIRKYLRTLSVSKNINAYADADVNNAIKFFIILHNMLMLEDVYYDQCMILDKSINKNLHLHNVWRVGNILKMYYRLYDKKHKVRINAESISNIEEIRLVLKDNKTLKTHLRL